MTLSTQEVQPVVSVIMAAYKSDKFLAAAIDSVLQQTLGNLELIVVIDGSPDGSARIAQQYAAQDQRVKVMDRAQNRGLAYSLNEGIQVARGKFIARMDPDDICNADRLARQVAWMEEQSVDLCGGWVRKFGAGVGRVSKYYADDKRIRSALLFNTAFAHPTIVARRQVFAEFRYAVDAGCAEDYELWTRIAAAGRHVMGNYPSVVLDYRVHPQQITRARAAEIEADKVAIAGVYWRAVPGVRDADPAVCADMVSRYAVLDADRFKRVLDEFQRLKRYVPEDVVEAYRFVFLLRHAYLGAGVLLRARAGLPIGQLQLLVLLGFYVLRAGEGGWLQQALRAFVGRRTG